MNSEAGVNYRRTFMLNILRIERVDMYIEKLEVGMIAANCYVVADEKTKRE
jgi:hypothetical protein